MKKIVEDPSAVNVTSKYLQIFKYNLATYVVLDINILSTYFQYRRSQVYKKKVSYTCTIWFFFFFIFFGVVELIMLTALRFSNSGMVCSGDFLKDKDPEYNPAT